ncbi:uncharacterized protein LOC108911437 [Anoplophora glabripennis]|uniref:uncharacterized protein LOC108911437 n=1 Tax=Anoplophora glabripennis TaxID=217634 RepID=UPI000873E233|nr:uncharacterized protein LOC108911437 [Anoplophora glabripennis]
MNKKFSISEGAISSHKCCLCGHLLSVAPIMSAGLENELYKCGRCNKVKCQTYTRTRLFEDVAQHLSFPCSYTPCDKKVAWGSVEKHERDCPYRTMKCPIYYHNCSDVVRVENLLEHFKDRHSKNIRPIDSIWELNIQFDYVFLTQIDNNCFLVYIMHLEEIFSISVLATGRSKYSNFSVKLLPSTDDKFAVYFDDLPVVRYDERSHCYMCIRKKCNEPHHPFAKRNSSGEIDLSAFASKLKKELIDSVKAPDGNLRYRITLKANETSSEHHGQPTEEEEEKEECEEEELCANISNIPADVNGEVLRRVLSCPYCMTYMAAPIFTCTIGHTICNVCRPRLEKCPSCAEPLGRSRNYALEEITKDARVPCQYDSKGCTFAGSTTKMYIHEQECSFSNLLRE